MTAIVNKNHGRIHRVTETPGYSSWAHMMSRCYNPRDKNYNDYGGRGISVCSRWHKSRNFLEDMGPRPDGMELERIDNAKGYNKSNCEWATRTTQCRNRRNVKLSLAIAQQLRQEYNPRDRTFVQRKARQHGCSDTAIRAAIKGTNYNVYSK